MHYKAMYPSEYLNAGDLDGKEFAVTIEGVRLEDVPDPNGVKKKKPVMYFHGAKKRFPLPKTCAKVLADRFGTDTDKWTGQKVTLYPTECMAFGKMTDCVRIK